MVSHAIGRRRRSPNHFRDRAQAGRLLAERLYDLKARNDVIVLGIPRGGVPVAYEIATALNAPLDVIVVRKIGYPGAPELAMGAVASGGVRVLNEHALSELPVPMSVIDAVTARELRELARRERAYRGDRPPVDPRDRTVVLVDDGLATGSSMRAAVTAVNQRGAGGIVVAVPVGATSTCRSIGHLVDRLECVIESTNFFAVGQWYDDFSQVTDDDVERLLASFRPEQSAIPAI